MLAKFLHFIYVFVRDGVGRLVRDVVQITCYRSFR